MKLEVYQSVVYQEGKHYVAQCLNVDVSSFGETEQEALELYLEDAPSSNATDVKHPTLHTLRPQHA